MSVQHLAELLNFLQLDPATEDVLDVLWLANHISGSGSEPGVGADEPSEPDQPPSDPPLRVPAQQHRPPVPAESEEADYAFHLRPVDDRAADGGGRAAMAVRAPAAPALGSQLNLTRALHPLRRMTDSRDRVVLDEEATAERIADAGLWIPTLTPEPTRWLELALVVDGYESMSIWRKPISELKALIEGVGTFRDVRYWMLDDGGGANSQPGVRRRAGSALRSPRELIDPTGERLIIVVSDCLGPMWQSRVAQNLLAEWARRGPVAIIQPLPQRLWRYSHAEPVEVRLHALHPGVPNSRLLWSAPAGSPGPATANAIPVPVLELDAAWMASWSRLVAGVGTADVDAQVTFVGGDVRQPTEPRPAFSDALRTPATRVRDFRQTASPGAVRLAEYLAAAPISLEVIRLVQKEMLGTSNVSAQAEVFLGGLLYRAGSSIDSRADVDPDDVMYEFIPGVREILLRRLRRHEAIRTLQMVSRYVGAQFGQARDFRALLVGGDLTGDLLIGPESRPFARVAGQVLGYLGGQYSATAASLINALDDSRVGTPAGSVTATYSPAQDEASQAIAPAETLVTSVSSANYEDQFHQVLAALSIDDRRSRRRPLVCPYCYHAFAEKEILFRCSGRSSAGRTACIAVHDTVFEEKLRQPATLPPVFEADARRDLATCPRCNCPTRTQVCPSCHSTLPATFRDVQGRLIALVGPSQAGKTAFMTVLIHELQNRTGERLNASIMGADDSTQDRFVSHYEWPIYEQSELKLTAPNDDRIVPLVFRLKMNQPARLRSNPHELLLSFADSAGEDLVSPEKIELMARYLAAADAVMILIDPLQFPAVRDQLSAETPVPRLAEGIGEPVSVFKRITSLMLAGTGQDVVEKPVTLVLSKLDVLWQLLKPDDLLQRQRPISPTFDNQDSVEVQERVRALLADWGASGIDVIAKQKYRRLRYFAVSALGGTPTMSNRVADGGIHPYRVSEPFTWLLSSFGFIRAS